MESYERALRRFIDEGLPVVLELLKTAQSTAIQHLPAVEAAVLNAVDAVFGPKQLMKQLVVAVCLQGAVFGYQWLGHFAHYLYGLCSAKGRQVLSLTQQMENAKTYMEWKKIAEQLDVVNGVDKWRRIEESSLYDCKVLKKRTKDIRWMINNGDVFNLMFRIRGGLARDMYGMQHEGLFSRARAGTKFLVEEYHDTVTAALNFICDSDTGDEIPTDAKLAFFNETRHSYGRTALLLSGGASLGYYHVGLATELFQQGLLPRVISGASAGSLMAAMIGTRTDEELEYLPQEKYRKDYLRFGWENSSASAAKMRFQYLFPQSLRWIGDMLFGCFLDNKSLLKLDTNHLKEVVIANTGLYTFQEAFDRTGRIINITVAPINNYDPPRLLNYLTAPHICVWSAALASCAIPGVFDTVPLMVKEPNGEFRPENEWTRGGPGSDVDELHPNMHHYSDGSIENDLPMQQLSELFNVNHFIVSQVNPHSALFSTLSVEATVWSPPLYGLIVGVLRFLKAQCRDWVRAVTDLLVYRAIAPSWSARRGVSQLLTQDYGGRESDITIMPWRKHLSLLTSWTVFMKNPSEEEYSKIQEVSMRNTWPYMSRIKAHCMVEVALDKCVQRLRKRISQENSQQGNAVPRGRVPSFYTTRSIVNLSGLSVADPLPGESEGSYEENMKALEQHGVLEQQSSLGALPDSPYKHTGAANIELTRDTGKDSPVVVPPLSQPQPSHSTGISSLFRNVSGGMSQTPSPEISAPSVPDARVVTADTDWYNIAVVGTDEPLQEGKKIHRENSGPLLVRRSNSGTAVAELQATASGSTTGTMERNKSADNIHSNQRDQKKNMEKTTSMANFYYKHAH